MKTKQLKTVRVMPGLIAAVCLVAAGVVKAADTEGTRGQLTAKDFKFVTAAAQAGMMEVSVGQVATQKASDQAVRDYGKRMVDEHQKANDELKDLATKKGATLPDTMDKKDQRALDHLNGLSGADFDKAYIKQMVSDHKKVVKEFQAESEVADDADLKAWVTKTLPVLQDHLQQAENIETSITTGQAKTVPPQ